MKRVQENDCQEHQGEDDGGRMQHALDYNGPLAADDTPAVTWLPVQPEDSKS